MSIKGHGLATVRDASGLLVQEVAFTNLGTDAGDLYHASQVLTGVGPAYATAPAPLTGMKLGSNLSTSAAKNGAGAALVAYLPASNQAFDTSFPKAVNLGPGAGVEAVYQATWGIGQVNSSNVNEIALVTDAGTDATSDAAHTVARAILPETVNLLTGGVFSLVWYILFLAD